MARAAASAGLSMERPTPALGRPVALEIPARSQPRSFELPALEPGPAFGRRMGLPPRGIWSSGSNACGCGPGMSSGGGPGRRLVDGRLIGRDLFRRRLGPNWRQRNRKQPPHITPNHHPGLIGVDDGGQLLLFRLNRDRYRLVEVALGEKHVDVFDAGILEKSAGYGNRTLERLQLLLLDLDAPAVILDLEDTRFTTSVKAFRIVSNPDFFSARFRLLIPARGPGR